MPNPPHPVSAREIAEQTTEAFIAAAEHGVGYRHVEAALEAEITAALAAQQAETREACAKEVEHLSVPALDEWPQVRAAVAKWLRALSPTPASKETV